MKSKNYKSRILSIFLAIIMLVGIVPTNVFAETQKADWTINEEKVAEMSYWKLANINELTVVANAEGIKTPAINYIGTYINEEGRTVIRVSFRMFQNTDSAVWNKALFKFDNDLYNLIDFENPKTGMYKGHVNYGWHDAAGYKEVAMFTNAGSSLSGSVNVKEQNLNNNDNKAGASSRLEIPIDLVLQEGKTVDDIVGQPHIQMRLTSTDYKRVFCVAGTGKASSDSTNNDGSDVDTNKLITPYNSYTFMTYIPSANNNANVGTVEDYRIDVQFYSANSYAKYNEAGGYLDVFHKQSKKASGDDIGGEAFAFRQVFNEKFAKVLKPQDDSKTVAEVFPASQQGDPWKNVEPIKITLNDLNTSDNSDLNSGFTGIQVATNKVGNIPTKFAGLNTVFTTASAKTSYLNGTTTEFNSGLPTITRYYVDPEKVAEEGLKNDDLAAFDFYSTFILEGTRKFIEYSATNDTGSNIVIQPNTKLTLTYDGGKTTTPDSNEDNYSLTFGEEPYKIELRSNFNHIGKIGKNFGQLYEYTLVPGMTIKDGEKIIFRTMKYETPPNKVTLTIPTNDGDKSIVLNPGKNGPEMNTPRRLNYITTYAGGSATQTGVGPDIDEIFTDSTNITGRTRYKLAQIKINEDFKFSAEKEKVLVSVNGVEKVEDNDLMGYTFTTEGKQGFTMPSDLVKDSVIKISNTDILKAAVESEKVEEKVQAKVTFDLNGGKLPTTVKSFEGFDTEKKSGTEFAYKLDRANETDSVVRIAPMNEKAANDAGYTPNGFNVEKYIDHNGDALTGDALELRKIVSEEPTKESENQSEKIVFLGWTTKKLEGTAKEVTEAFDKLKKDKKVATTADQVNGTETFIFDENSPITTATTVYAAYGLDQLKYNFEPEYTEADGRVGTPTTITAPNFKDKDGQDTTRPEGTTFKLGENAPKGAEINPDTGEIKYTPVEGDAGKTVNIPVVVKYSDGSTDEVTADIIVGGLDDVIDRTKDPTKPTPEGYVRVTFTNGEGVNDIENNKVYDVKEGKVLTSDKYPQVTAKNEYENPVWSTPAGTPINKDNATITATATKIGITPTPNITKPKAGDQEITGTSEPNAEVVVEFPDETKVITTADNDGEWTAPVPKGKEPKENDIIKAVATVEGKQPSEEATATTGKADPIPDTTAPNIDKIDDQTVVEKQPIKEIEVKTDDPQAEITVGGLPNGVKYDKETGKITGNPEITDWNDTDKDNPEEVREVTVKVTAKDEAGNESTEEFTITVQRDTDGDGIPDIYDKDDDGDGVPDEVEKEKGTDSKNKDEKPLVGIIEPKGLKPVEDKTVIEKKKIDPIKVEGEDPNAVIEVSNLPDGLKYEPKTKEITGTPTISDWGQTEEERTVTVEVTVNNEDGTAVIETFKITVQRDTDAICLTQDGLQKQFEDAANAMFGRVSTKEGVYEASYDSGEKNVTVKILDKTKPFSELKGTGLIAGLTELYKENYLVKVQIGSQPARDLVEIRNASSDDAEFMQNIAQIVGSDIGNEINGQGSNIKTLADFINKNVELKLTVEQKDCGTNPVVLTYTIDGVDGTQPAEKTDAEKNPAVEPEKTEVKDKTKLTPEEKTEVEKKVKDKNPKADKVEVGDDGSVTITYPDDSTNTLTPDQTVVEKTPAEYKAIFNSNGGTPTTQRVSVKEGEIVTGITEPTREGYKFIKWVKAGTNIELDLTKPFDNNIVSEGETSLLFTAQWEKIETDADRNPAIEPDKTEVEDKTALTDEEKAMVEEEVKKVNPEATDVTVADDGTATLTYPDDSTNTLTPEQTITERAKTDAEKNPAVEPEKTEVKDKNKLTDDEKKSVEDKVKDKNPEAKDVTVGDDGSVTITYPDDSTNTLKPDQTVVEKTPAEYKAIFNSNGGTPTTQRVSVKEGEIVTGITEPTREGYKFIKWVKAGTNIELDLTKPFDNNIVSEGETSLLFTAQWEKIETDADRNPAIEPDKTEVEDKTALTDEEKAMVEEEVKKVNPEATDVTVADDGTATLTYPDDSTNTLTPDQTVVEKDATDAEKNPAVAPEKTEVKDKNNLTDEEKAKVEEEVKKVNPEAKDVTVNDDGSVVITYPDDSTNTLTPEQTVVEKDATDAEKYQPEARPIEKAYGVPTNREDIKDSIVIPGYPRDKERPEIIVNNPSDLPDGRTAGRYLVDVTVIYPDGTKDNVRVEVIVKDKEHRPEPWRPYYPSRRPDARWIPLGVIPEYIDRIELPIDSDTTKYIKGTHDAYMFGYEDGSIRPDSEITRVEAFALIARVSGLPLNDDSRPNFKDVEGGWYNKEVNALIKAGYVNGYEDNTLRLNDPISRAEFTKVASFLGKDKEANAPFTDIKGNWAENYINRAYANGWVDGYEDGTFKPNNSIQRAEVVKILNKALDRAMNDISLKTLVNKEAVKTFTDLTPSHWAYNELREATNTHEYQKLKMNQTQEEWLLIK